MGVPVMDALSDRLLQMIACISKDLKQVFLCMAVGKTAVIEAGHGDSNL
jgi:hypothetical protein